MLLVELGRDLADVGQGEGSPLVKHIRDFRERLLKASGFRLPSVRIMVKDDLPPNAYVVRVRLKCVTQGVAHKDRVLAVVSDPKDVSRLNPLSGQTAPDPIFGLPSRWIFPRQENRARDLGLTVATPANVVAGHVEESLLRHLPE